MTDAEILARITLAVNQQDADPAAPTGPIRALMTTFAEGGDLAALSLCYLAHRRAHPRAARYVLSKIPEKIYTGYLHRHQAISLPALAHWAVDHPEWRDLVTSTVSNPAMFATSMAATAAQAKSFEKE